VGTGVTSWLLLKLVDGRGGAIRIELSASGPTAQCQVTDTGSSSGVAQSGNGLKIIEELVRELDGEIVHRFEIAGATSILIFPIDDTSLNVDLRCWLAASPSGAHR
jgi:hypothetical protein